MQYTIKWFPFLHDIGTYCCNRESIRWNCVHSAPGQHTDELLLGRASPMRWHTSKVCCNSAMWMAHSRRQSRIAARQWCTHWHPNNLDSHEPIVECMRPLYRPCCFCTSSKCPLCLWWSSGSLVWQTDAWTPCRWAQYSAQWHCRKKKLNSVISDSSLRPQDLRFERFPIQFLRFGRSAFKIRKSMHFAQIFHHFANTWIGHTDPWRSQGLQIRNNSIVSAHFNHMHCSVSITYGQKFPDWQ